MQASVKLKPEIRRSNPSSFSPCNTPIINWLGLAVSHDALSFAFFPFITFCHIHDNFRGVGRFYGSIIEHTITAVM